MTTKQNNSQNQQKADGSALLRPPCSLECPECDGEGTIRDNYEKDGKYVFHRAECERCNGTGYVDDYTEKEAREIIESAGYNYKEILANAEKLKLRLEAKLSANKLLVDFGYHYTGCKDSVILTTKNIQFLIAYHYKSNVY